MFSRKFVWASSSFRIDALIASKSLFVSWFPVCNPWIDELKRLSISLLLLYRILSDVSVWTLKSNRVTERFLTSILISSRTTLVLLMICCLFSSFSLRESSRFSFKTYIIIHIVQSCFKIQYSILQNNASIFQ